MAAGVTYFEKIMNKRDESGQTKYYSWWLLKTNLRYIFGPAIPPVLLLIMWQVFRSPSWPRDIAWARDIGLSGFLSLVGACAALGYFAYRAQSGQFSSALNINLTCSRHLIKVEDKKENDLLVMEVEFEGKSSFALRIHEIQIRIGGVRPFEQENGKAGPILIHAEKLPAGEGKWRFGLPSSTAPAPALTEEKDEERSKNHAANVIREHFAEHGSLKEGFSTTMLSSRRATRLRSLGRLLFHAVRPCSWTWPCCA